MRIKFHERKTRTRSPEETGGLAQPDRGQEGPFSGGQGLQAKNLEDAWLRVKGNGGAGGVDGQTLMDFEKVLESSNWTDSMRNSGDDTYQPLPVRRHLIPKAGQPGKSRPLGIPDHL